MIKPLLNSLKRNSPPLTSARAEKVAIIVANGAAAKATIKEFAREIDAHLNTKNRQRNQWAQITDARSGQVLHTGQPCYIKQVAKKKYNTVLNF